MKHKKSKKKELLRRLRTKQRVVQFADPFQFVLHVVIILQPTLDLFFLFGPDADLFVSASRIVDRKDQGRMPFAAGACLTTLLMPNRALQEGTAHDLEGLADRSGETVALAEGLLRFHLIG